MKILKEKQTSYTSLHLCLEPHFGEKRSRTETAPPKYREPEQGFRTVPFQSRYPLTLDYMQRPKNRSFFHSLISSPWKRRSQP